MQAKRAKKAIASDGHKLTPSEFHIVSQSKKDIIEGKYRKYSSVQELLKAIKSD